MNKIFKVLFVSLVIPMLFSCGNNSPVKVSSDKQDKDESKVRQATYYYDGSSIPPGLLTVEQIGGSCSVVQGNQACTFPRPYPETSNAMGYESLVPHTAKGTLGPIPYVLSKKLPQYRSMNPRYWGSVSYFKENTNPPPDPGIFYSPFPGLQYSIKQAGNLFIYESLIHPGLKYFSSNFIVYAGYCDSAYNGIWGCVGSGYQSGGVNYANNGTGMSVTGYRGSSDALYPEARTYVGPYGGMSSGGWYLAISGNQIWTQSPTAYLASNAGAFTFDLVEIADRVTYDQFMPLAGTLQSEKFLVSIDNGTPVEKYTFYGYRNDGKYYEITKAAGLGYFKRTDGLEDYIYGAFGFFDCGNTANPNAMTTMYFGQGRGTSEKAFVTYTANSTSVTSTDTIQMLLPDGRCQKVTAVR